MRTRDAVVTQTAQDAVQFLVAGRIGQKTVVHQVVAVGRFDMGRTQVVAEDTHRIAVEAQIGPDGRRTGRIDIVDTVDGARSEDTQFRIDGKRDAGRPLAVARIDRPTVSRSDQRIETHRRTACQVAELFDTENIGIVSVHERCQRIDRAPAVVAVEHPHVVGHDLQRRAVVDRFTIVAQRIDLIIKRYFGTPRSSSTSIGEA